MWKLNKTLLNNQWVKEEITREIRKLETNENENIPKFIGCKKTTKQQQQQQQQQKTVLRGKFFCVCVIVAFFFFSF